MYVLVIPLHSFASRRLGGAQGHVVILSNKQPRQLIMPVPDNDPCKKKRAQPFPVSEWASQWRPASAKTRRKRRDMVFVVSDLSEAGAPADTAAV